MQKLIEKVKEYPELYNTNHEDYVKKTLKDVIWQNISEELNYRDGEEVKAIWFKLRNCHRDALRRKFSKNKNGIAVTKIWKYEKQMAFLINYMNTKLLIENAQEIANETDTKDIELIDLEFIKTDDGSDYSDTEGNTQKIVPDALYSQNENDSEFLYGTTSPEQKKRKLNEKSRNNISIETKYYEEHPEKVMALRQNSLDGEDDLFHFYMSMYATTKKLPLLNQIKIKRLIFNIVADEQEEVLCCTSSATK